MIGLCLKTNKLGVLFTRASISLIGILMFLIILMAPKNCFAQEVEMKSSPQLIKKLDWLKKHGEKVWIGPRERRIQKVACRVGENRVLFYNDWGLSKGLVHQEVVSCPSFFFEVEDQ